MSDNVRVHIGTPDDMGQRFIDAWHRAERGEAVSETNVTFRDLETLLAALTPKRLHLLRYVRHYQVPSIKALATGLHRNYKNVHKDVEELTKLGLLSRPPDRSWRPMPKWMPASCFRFAARRMEKPEIAAGRLRPGSFYSGALSLILTRNSFARIYKGAAAAMLLASATQRRITFWLELS